MKFFFMLILSAIGHLAVSQETDQKMETLITGVYQGRMLFIQNPFNGETKKYCIDHITINKKQIGMNYNMSAIKLDFDELDLYTPVTIKIKHRDTLCTPVIINPEAILFHTIFRFTDLILSDSTLVWTTKGERGKGVFAVEKLDQGVWVERQGIEASGVYEGAGYSFFPKMDEGGNKYRIKYHFPSGSRLRHLYSWEMDYDYYPNPVTFTQVSATTKIHLSRFSSYEIFNAKRELVLTGQGVEIDITVLRRGQYVIYFDGKDPGAFYKE